MICCICKQKVHERCARHYQDGTSHCHHCHCYMLEGDQYQFLIENDINLKEDCFDVSARPFFDYSQFEKSFIDQVLLKWDVQHCHCLPNKIQKGNLRCLSLMRNCLKKIGRNIPGNIKEFVKQQGRSFYKFMLPRLLQQSTIMMMPTLTLSQYILTREKRETKSSFS